MPGISAAGVAPSVGIELEAVLELLPPPLPPLPMALPLPSRIIEPTGPSRIPALVNPAPLPPPPLLPVLLELPPIAPPPVLPLVLVLPEPEPLAAPIPPKELADPAPTFEPPDGVEELPLLPA